MDYKKMGGVKPGQNAPKDKTSKTGLPGRKTPKAELLARLKKAGQKS